MCTQTLLAYQTGMSKVDGARAQAFAHKIVEFAEPQACAEFFQKHDVDMDQPNDQGWTVLMSVCAKGRVDLVGYVMDQTTNIQCATVANRSNVLHLAAMASDPLVMTECVATPERKEKLKPIVNQSNNHGDTPLMMACVAKNVSAVRLLIDDLQADVTHANDDGVTALMCAARVKECLTEAEELDIKARSDAILCILMANGAPVNAVETSSKHTALHFAVISDNEPGVKVLLEQAPQIDLTLKNSVGLTAEFMAKGMGMDQESLDLFQQKRTTIEAQATKAQLALEEQALRLQRELEEEASLVKQQSQKARNGKKKSKKKADSNQKLLNAAMQTSVEAPEASDVVVKTETAETVSVPPAVAEEVGSLNDGMGDAEDWQTIGAKKSRRKVSVSPSNDTSPNNTAPSKPQQHRSSKATAPSKPQQHLSSKATTPFKAESKKAVQKSSNASSPPSTAKAVLQSTVSLQKPIQQQIKPPNSLQPAQARPVQVREDSETPASSYSYDQLNQRFHRMFPMAAEIEIGVEHFILSSAPSVASAATGDDSFDSADGLSISQVEILQEAHLQAYHYLTEKKMELARQLETQRLEAQFALQTEIMYLNE